MSPQHADVRQSWPGAHVQTLEVQTLDTKSRRGPPDRHGTPWQPVTVVRAGLSASEPKPPLQLGKRRLYRLLTMTAFARRHGSLCWESVDSSVVGSSDVLKCGLPQLHQRGTHRNLQCGSGAQETNAVSFLSFYRANVEKKLRLS